jgi:hypothetical protein
MYDKGKSFIGAAILLEQRGGNQYVVLHLICQGVECVLKAILLSIDYERYSPLLKDKLGHKLVKIASAVGAETSMSLKPALLAELSNLDNLYARHLLRYGSGFDIVVDPKSVAYGKVMHRCAAMIRLIETKGLLHPGNFRTK